MKKIIKSRTKLKNVKINDEKINTDSKKNYIKLILFIFMLYYKFIFKIEQKKETESNLELIFPSSYSNTNEYDYGRLYFQICDSGKLYGAKRYKIEKNPKLSIIIPVYNREQTLTRALRSIQNQNYKNIEIIFVDDKSTDNSLDLIKLHQRKDKRIKLIQHEKNKGTFITRNDGALIAKGEYITFLDPDDIFYEGIIKKIIGSAKLYNSDIIRFEAFYRTNSQFNKYNYGNYFEKNNIITQPKIFKQTFYNYNGELYQHNLFLWGKIIKKKLFMDVFYYLTDYYKNQHWTLYEDNALDFLLLKYAKTYTYTNDNGYIYCYNKESSYITKNNKEKANKTIKDLFLFAEFCFDYTNDNEYEKQMAIHQIKRVLTESKSSLEIVTDGFEYFYMVLNKFFNCKSILPRHLEVLGEIKNILKRAEKEAYKNI